MFASFNYAGKCKLSSMQGHMLLNPSSTAALFPINLASFPEAAEGGGGRFQLIKDMLNLRRKEKC